ncbi:MAG: hypothetical protein E7Z89_02450 [Cyanobacteria bacterium SIG28]|nr:hypothetical protein [Cyanobacteria bacterium SIG28]
MSERRFLGFVFIESLILITLGLCVLILPKLTSLTFGVMLSSAFIAYGLYKIIFAFVNRNYALNILWRVFLGAFVLTLGILLLLVPKISLLWLIALIGVYFLLESISLTAFISHIENMFNFMSCKYFGAIVLFTVGLAIVVGLPIMSFWLVAMLSGIALLIKGMSKLTLYLTNKNN